MNGTLDPTRFVVLGKGLAAGIGHFGLTEDVQAWSFPALAAEKLGADYAQPLFEPPGVGSAVGRRVELLRDFVSLADQTQALRSDETAQATRDRLAALARFEAWAAAQT